MKKLDPKEDTAMRAHQQQSRALFPYVGEAILPNGMGLLGLN